MPDPALVQPDLSGDAKPPKAGPGFIRLNSPIYRLEMLTITVIIFAVLWWRLFLVRDANVYAAIFWVVWPDLASFIPIGVAARGSRDWPPWGSGLYNFFHTFLVVIPLLAIWSLATGTVQWAMLGWIGHITMDRSVGYYLRARPSKT